MKGIIAFLLCVIPLQVDANELQLHEVFDAACRISTPRDFFGRMNVGTGTVVSERDGKYYILTNGHVIYPNKIGSTVVVEFFSQDGYKSKSVLARVESISYQPKTSSDMAVISIPSSLFQKFKPKVIQLAPKETKVQIGDKIFGAGCPSGRWVQGWVSRVTATSTYTFSFSADPEGGQSGSGILKNIKVDGKDETRLVGILTWRKGQGASSYGGGVALDNIYRIIENKPMEAAKTVETGWIAIAQIKEVPQYRYVNEPKDKDEICSNISSVYGSCGYRKEEHFYLIHKNTGQIVRNSDGTTRLFCPHIPYSTVQYYRQPYCAGPTPQPDTQYPPIGSEGPSQGDSSPLWPDRPIQPTPVEPKPAPPIEEEKSNPEIEKLNNEINKLKIKIEEYKKSGSSMAGRVKELEDSLKKKQEQLDNASGKIDVDKYNEVKGELEEKSSEVGLLNDKVEQYQGMGTIDKIKSLPWFHILGLVAGVAIPGIGLGGLGARFVMPWLISKTGRIPAWLIMRYAKKKLGKKLLSEKEVGSAGADLLSKYGINFLAKNQDSVYNKEERTKEEQTALNNIVPVSTERTVVEPNITQNVTVNTPAFDPDRYSVNFFKQNNDRFQGEHVSKWSGKLQYYREAVALMRKNQLPYNKHGIELFQQQQAAEAIDRHVTNQVLYHIDTANFGGTVSEYQNAMIAVFYFQAVELLREGQLPALNYTAIADAIDDYVANKTLKHLGINL